MTESVDFALDDFFDQARRAVAASQEKLDRVINPAARARSEPWQQLFYAFPRAAFTLESAIAFDKKKGVLFTRRRRRSTLSHRVGFELIAVPEPPAAPEGDPFVELVEPAILFPAAEEERLLRLLVEVLAKGAAGTDWWLVDEETTRRLAADRPKRLARVRDESKLLLPESMVFFRLAGGRALAVRVEDDGEGKHDGLFVVEPGGEPPVTIFSFRDDRQSAINYEPLHLLSRNVRRWLAGRLPDRRSPWRRSDRLGFGDLDDFVGRLATAYRDSLTTLARQQEGAGEQEIAPRSLPSFYDLAGVEARLRFAVETTGGRVSFREAFGARRDDSIAIGGDDDEAEMPTSRVAIRADRAAGLLRITVALHQLEFLPRDAARQTLLEQLLAQAGAIAEAVDSRRPQRYLQLLRDPELARDAVLFRSYRDQQIEEELVVVWPSGAGVLSLDFAFAALRKAGRIEEDSIRKVMSLDDALHGVTINQEQFGPFHRFFSAVRLWRNRGTPA